MFHDGNLMSTLVIVTLIDADLIDPDPDFRIGFPNALQCVVQILRNSKSKAVQQDGDVAIGGRSPTVSKAAIALTRLPRVL